MSYISLILIMLMVSSPLLVPIGVTVVHNLRTWRLPLP